MRALLVLGVLLAALPAGMAEAQAPIVVRALVGRPDRQITDTMGTPYEVPASAARAFSAVAAVFAELKIPTELRDSAALEVGSEQFFARGKVGGRRISASLECGEGMTGPHADNNKIDVSLVTFITATGAETATVRSVLLGTAVNVTEGAHPTQACRSTNDLERRIHQLVLKRLGGVSP